MLHPTYWPEVRRGSERLIHDLGTGLASRGHQVTLFTTHSGPRSRAMEDGIRIVRIRRRDRRRLRHLEYFSSNIPHSLWHLLHGRFDVVHAFFPTEAWAAVQARRLWGPPVVSSFHGIPQPEYLQARDGRLRMLETIARRAEVTTVLSEAAAEAYRKELGRTPEIAPGGVLAARFAVDVPRATQPTIICAATLQDPRKRGPLLMAAFRRLCERRPDARLLIAGRPDPVLSEIELDLPDGAELVDLDSTDDLARAYAAAWVSVLPSVEEAFGLVLIESLAAGTPVVAARSGACPEILSNDLQGRLFEPDDESDLVRALEEGLDLVDDPAVSLACRARAKDYDWSSILDRYESLYEMARVTARGRPSRKNR